MPARLQDRGNRGHSSARSDDRDDWADHRISFWQTHGSASPNSSRHVGGRPSGPRHRLLRYLSTSIVGILLKNPFYFLAFPYAMALPRKWIRGYWLRPCSAASSRSGQGPVCGRLESSRPTRGLS